MPSHWLLIPSLNFINRMSSLGLFNIKKPWKFPVLVCYPFWSMVFAYILLINYRRWLRQKQKSVWISKELDVLTNDFSFIMKGKILNFFPIHSHSGRAAWIDWVHYWLTDLTLEKKIMFLYCFTIYEYKLDVGFVKPLFDVSLYLKRYSTWILKTLIENWKVPYIKLVKYARITKHSVKSLKCYFKSSKPEIQNAHQKELKSKPNKSKPGTKFLFFLGFYFRASSSLSSFSNNCVTRTGFQRFWYLWPNFITSAIPILSSTIYNIYFRKV